VTVYPIPSWPYNITPYLFVIALVGGFGYMRWLEAYRPEALRQGATILVGNPFEGEGDLDWDSTAAPSSSLAK
jgi:hypothetical protein